LRIPREAWRNRSGETPRRVEGADEVGKIAEPDVIGDIGHRRHCRPKGAPHGAAASAPDIGAGDAEHSENSRRKWNGLISAWAAASSRSIGRCECASIQRAASTARGDPARAAAGLARRRRPLDKRWRTAARPRRGEIAPAIGRACASSPSTINSGSAGGADLPDIGRSPIVSPIPAQKNDRHSSRRRDRGYRHIRRRDGRPGPIRLQLEEAAAAAAAETALAHKGDRVGAMRSTYGVSPGPALQRKSDTEMDWRCSRVVTFMPEF